MKKRELLHLTIFILPFLVLQVSCSSKPKNTGDIYVLRNHAEAGLELGNSRAGQGEYGNALATLRESKRNAILTDDSSLIIRASLSLGNLLLSMGRIDEAFNEWEQAVAEAERSKNNELLSVSKVYLARGSLVSGRASAQSVLDDVNREQANIKTDRLNIAYSWQVKGLALRALGQYSEAEDAVNRSLEIHQKDMSLENASYDLYTIASIRSVAGNTTGALQALEESLAIDRRIENSWGLAAGYRAMGDVYRRAGKNQESLDAYNRAIAIYEAMRNDHEAAETKKRMGN